eukprot:6100569-Amphidinium_carterae.2
MLVPTAHTTDTPSDKARTKIDTASCPRQCLAEGVCLIDLTDQWRRDARFKSPHWVLTEGAKLRQ